MLKVVNILNDGANTQVSKTEPKSNPVYNYTSPLKTKLVILFNHYILYIWKSRLNLEIFNSKFDSTNSTLKMCEKLDL